MKKTVALLLLCAFAVSLQGQDQGKLTLERIFTNREFQSEWFGPSRWIDNGDGYTTLETSKAYDPFRDIVT